MSKLRVAVNLLWCIPGAVGGSEQYMVRQLSGLIATADQHRDRPVALTVFASRDFEGVHGQQLMGAHFVPGRGDGNRRSRRMLDESTWLHRRTAAFDIVHHGGGTAPARARRPYVVTVHDLQYRTFPQYFSTTKRAYLDAVMPRSVRGAAVVTVPSAYVRTSVIEHFGVDAASVMVVPHGYEPGLLEHRTPEHELRARFSMGDGPVIVYPAMTAPHKNHRFLIELMQQRWTDPDLRLVLIGGRGLADAEVTALIAGRAGLQRRIIRPGRVSDADRNGLLAMATALVFPSQYEGFGAPVIEAMALGAPVVCSDVTCLPEVVGDAGVVLPLQLDAWADAIDDVTRRRADLIAAGHRRVESFTAEKSGEALRLAYERAAA
jgi:glycosyltransferase involved in cell wall biosynthesis